MKQETLNHIPPGLMEKARERISSNHTVGDNGCWVWNLSSDRYGYARTKITVDGHYWSTTAHRLSYLAFNGDIAEGLQVDHLCRNTMCVNPAHLDAVTEDENNRRRIWAGSEIGACKRGHIRTESNTRTRIGPRGGIKRDCKDCEKLRILANAH